MVSIAIEPPRQPEILRLLEESDEYALSLYPPESCYLLDLGELEAEGVSVFVARLDGGAVGMAALVDRRDGSAELKRMIVREDIRGHGIGTQLLKAIEEHAQSEAIGLIQLETGTLHEAAFALYSKHGFRQISKFGEYVKSPHSVCMEKPLTPQQ